MDDCSSWADIGWAFGSVAAGAADPFPGNPLAKATKKTEGITKEFLPRKAPGRDGGLSVQIIERQSGEVISRTHKVFKDGKSDRADTGKGAGGREEDDIYNQ